MSARYLGARALVAECQDSGARSGSPAWTVMSRLPITAAVLAAMGTGACASAPEPIVTEADIGSLACAAALLAAGDYEVDREAELVTGETRVMAGEVGVTREFVSVKAVQAGNRLEVSAAAYRLDPAMHAAPVNRQTASSVVPSSETQRLAQEIADRCAAGR